MCTFIVRPFGMTVCAGPVPPVTLPPSHPANQPFGQRFCSSNPAWLMRMIVVPCLPAQVMVQMLSLVLRGSTSTSLPLPPVFAALVQPDTIAGSPLTPTPATLVHVTRAVAADAADDSANA